ncbi:MAG: GNAT family N-acetyltransferase, partial [Cetobacterium sp.]
MYKSYIYEDIENKLEEFQELDKNFFLDKEGMYYTIENKNEIIAYILLEKNENDYKLKRIFVRKDERFKSYGTKLLLFIINKKIKKGNLIVGKENSISDFLIKIGFKKKEDGEFVIE